MFLGGTHECYFRKISKYGDQTERSGCLEWRSHRCPKVTGNTSLTICYLNSIEMCNFSFEINTFDIDESHSS